MSSSFTAVPGFGWRELTERLQISHRQLQWLDEREIVVARRLGHKRIYDESAAMLVGIALELRRKHCNHAKLKAAMRNITRVGRGSLPNYLLVTSKGAVCGALNEMQVVQVALHEKTPVSVIDTRRIARKLCARGMAAGA